MNVLAQILDLGLGLDFLGDQKDLARTVSECGLKQSIETFSEAFKALARKELTEKQENDAIASYFILLGIGVFSHYDGQTQCPHGFRRFDCELCTQTKI